MLSSQPQLYVTKKGDENDQEAEKPGGEDKAGGEISGSGKKKSQKVVGFFGRNGRLWEDCCTNENGDCACPLLSPTKKTIKSVLNNLFCCGFLTPRLRAIALEIYSCQL